MAGKPYWQLIRDPLVADALRRSIAELEERIAAATPGTDSSERVIALEQSNEKAHRDFESRLADLETAPAPAALLGFSGPAGEILGGDIAVALSGGQLVKASPDGLPAVGFTAHAAAQGASVQVRQLGEATFANLTPGALYFLAANGTITTTPPASGWLQSLGSAISASRLAVEIGPPIQR